MSANQVSESATVIAADKPTDAIADESGTVAIEPVQSALPIVPTQAELQAEADRLQAEIDARTAEGDPDAPYGRKADGSPRARPGRKAAVSKGEQFERLDSVSPARELPRASSTVKTTQPQTPFIAANYRELGETAASLWIKVGAIALGPDWAPDMDNPDERQQPQQVASAFESYFRTKEIKAIDPTLALVLVLGTYTISKADKPSVKSKFAGAKQWVKSKLHR